MINRNCSCWAGFVTSLGIDTGAPSFPRIVKSAGSVPPDTDVVQPTVTSAHSASEKGLVQVTSTSDVLPIPGILK